MKIRLTCIACIREKIQNNKDYIVGVRDDNVYEITCVNGHESIVILESHRFELLFEMGVYALLDGYYREAISNFAAAIERFHEFSIEIFVKHSLSSVSFIDEFGSAWKQVSSQSERQLGAYILLYLITFNRSPELMKRKYTELRNDVIHKGKFPSKEEAYGFANATFEYIKEKLLELKKERKQTLEFIYEKNLRNYIVKNNVNNKFMVHWRENMTFRSSKPYEDINNISFEDYMKKEFKPFINE